MVAKEESSKEYLKYFYKAPTPDEIKEIKESIRLVQKSFTIEADNGFVNIRGKESLFNDFLYEKLLSLTKTPFSDDIKSRISDLAVLYSSYPDKSINQRQHVIAKSRKFLFLLGKNIEESKPTSNPILNFQSNKKSNNISSTFSDLSINLDSSVTSIKGVGEKVSEKLSSIGLLTIRDLFMRYPRDYIDYTSLKRINSLEIGETATIVATIKKSSGFISPKNRNLSIIELQLQDSTGRLKATKFLIGNRFSNQYFIKKQCKLYSPGKTVAVSGLVKDVGYGKVIADPLIELMETSRSIIRSKVIGQLVSVYSLTDGLSSDFFRDLIYKISPLANQFIDPLPVSIKKKLSLLNRSDAIIQIHNPKDQNILKAARRRLVFDEFLVLQLGLLLRRQNLLSRRAPSLNLFSRKEGLIRDFLNLLPFPFTSAQKRVLREIENDLIKSAPMARLLQGDVGSGKTVVAVAALLQIVQGGYQGTMMAPTEVLAEQHYRNFCNWLTPLHVNVELLTGSTPLSRRRRIINNLSNGSLKIIVGTHALIEEYVDFFNLGLVVVDEQHRFGVKQRNKLLSKGIQPHFLAMTATPIPRSLALSIYGDLDVSQIDELPPGRTPIITKLLSSSQRNKAYKLIREELNKGQKAYVVLPLVEESEKLDLRSAVTVYKQLSEEIFTDFKVGLLHGRLSSQEKQSVISRFSNGDCQILVSTTVVEVGVDVSSATVMLIDNADRFGLAQLHQLRGRVGRGAKQSYCLLINESKNQLSKQRLEVLVSTNDGFEISEIDLRLRGPGQVLGTRQSGLPDFALASLSEDSLILDEARNEATSLLEADPGLKSNPLLRKLLDEEGARLYRNLNLN